MLGVELDMTLSDWCTENGLTWPLEENNNADLKALLKTLGEKTGGNKPDLINRINTRYLYEDNKNYRLDEEDFKEIENRFEENMANTTLVEIDMVAKRANQNKFNTEDVVRRLKNPETTLESLMGTDEEGHTICNGMPFFISTHQ